MILKQPDERAIARFPFRSGVTYRRSLTVIIKTTGSIKKKNVCNWKKAKNLPYNFQLEDNNYEAVKMIYFLLHQFDLGKIETTVSLSSLSLPQNCPDFQI